MAYTMSNADEGGLPPFFVSGKFSDFALKLPMFSFRVHKVVISSKSRYFEALCGDTFLVCSAFRRFAQILTASQEGSRGFVELADEEDPAMIARLLQVMYCGDYGTDFYEALVPIMMQNSLVDKEAFAITKRDDEPPTYKVRK
jgi:BTB/POZ domain